MTFILAKDLSQVTRRIRMHMTLLITRSIFGNASLSSIDSLKD